MKKAKPANDIDDYIARCPADVQPILEKVRTTNSGAAPDAKEVISYQMPAFKQHGILVYFAAWKKHIGLYPPIYVDKAIERQSLAMQARMPMWSKTSLRYWTNFVIRRIPVKSSEPFCSRSRRGTLIARSKS